MKKMKLLLGLLGLTTLFANAQNVQENVLATSGGLEAGITTSGDGLNTFYGYRAGKNSTTGSNNTFIGTGAGKGITTGSQNIMIGVEAGSSTLPTINGNLFIGYGAGQATYGNQNIMIGNYAGGEGGGSTASNCIFIGTNAGFSETENDKLIIGDSESDRELIKGDFALRQLKFNGKVGVGYGFGNYPTTAGSINIANYNLFVKGGILTEEVRVSLQSTWADYVFKKDYKLPTLKEVENHIAQKGHLINVPSAEEVKNNGIELGEMAKIQQEKIEELTLYIIDQNKINEQQAKQLQEQTKQIEELKILTNQLIEKTK